MGRQAKQKQIRKAAAPAASNRPAKFEEMDLLRFKVVQLDLERTKERHGRLVEESAKVNALIPDAKLQLVRAEEAYNAFMREVAQKKYGLTEADSFNDKSGHIEWADQAGQKSPPSEASGSNGASEAQAQASA